MDLYLIRHGESKQNTKENYTEKLPSHKIPLTERGIKQSNDAGIFLKNYLTSNNIEIENAVIWVSPFLRTRQTAQIINNYLNISDIREDYSLIEQRYGLFSDRSVLRNKMMFENEFSYYDNYYQNDGKFYAKLPQGEAPMDVAIRTRQFLNMINEDNKKPIFIISHGTAIKTIIMNTHLYSPEWFNKEPVMDNCSIKIINKDKHIDKFIYGGYAKKLQK